MAYRIEYARGVVKDLSHLPDDVKTRALRAIEGVLAEAPREGRPLTGPYRGLWKYRIGDYRIIYRIEDDSLIVFVLRVRHRKDVYDGM